MIIALLVLCLFALLAYGAHTHSVKNDIIKNLRIDLTVSESRWRADLDRWSTEADIRNEYLDYLFRTFQLHIPNPFVTRPNFEEKRCFFCYYPEYAGHDQECAWLHCRPLTSVLYNVPPQPVDESGPTTGDLVFKVPEDATVSPNPSK